MSRTRRSPESVVVELFQTAEPEMALMLYRIVRGILEQRGLFKAPRRAGAKGRRPVPALESSTTKPS